jgi:hypothetical protein
LNNQKEIDEEFLAMIRIGDLGETSTPLTPGGFVIVAGNRLPARCASGYLDVKQAVIVIGGDNLGLLVRGVNSETVPQDLPSRGQVVFASFGAKVKTEGEIHAAAQMEQLQAAVSQSIRLGGATGLAVGVLVVARMWLNEQGALDGVNSSGPAAMMILTVGLIWGLAVGRTLFGMFERMGYTKLSALAVFSIVSTLAAAGVTFSVVFPTRGLLTGLFSSLSATVVSGCTLLALAMLGEWMGGEKGESSTASDAAAGDRD